MSETPLAPGTPETPPSPARSARSGAIRKRVKYMHKKNTPRIAPIVRIAQARRCFGSARGQRDSDILYSAFGARLAVPIALVYRGNENGWRRFGSPRCQNSLQLR